jgi:hypothetical protein
MRRNREPRPIFILRIEGKPGAAGIHALRFLLKRLLRQYGFVCVDIREEPAPAPDVSNQVADCIHRASPQRER